MAAGFIEFPVSIANELQEARVKDDDWSGKTDPAERRRRQNRLHQRAWRRRKALPSVTQSTSGPACQEGTKNLQLLSLTNLPFTSGEVPLRQLAQDHVSGRQRMPITFESPQGRLAFWTALETLGEPQSTFAYWAELRAYRKREITSTLLLQHPSPALQNPESCSYQANCVQPSHVLTPNPTGDISHGQHTPAFKFPLSADHQLFVLIQHNALRGIMANMSILLHLNGRPFEGWADLYTEDLPIPPENAPSPLHPTYLQKSISHESWVDVIPYPAMRDNILRTQDTLDGDALCDDFLGGMCNGLSEVQSRGMILWGDPWSKDGWEISDGFARKWSFLLEGCSDLVNSTNRWRDARDEERLVVEV